MAINNYEVNQDRLNQAYKLLMNPCFHEMRVAAIREAYHTEVPYRRFRGVAEPLNEVVWWGRWDAIACEKWLTQAVVDFQTARVTKNFEGREGKRHAQASRMSKYRTRLLAMKSTVYLRTKRRLTWDQFMETVFRDKQAEWQDKLAEYEMNGQRVHREDFWADIDQEVYDEFIQALKDTGRLETTDITKFKILDRRHH